MNPLFPPSHVLKIAGPVKPASPASAADARMRSLHNWIQRFVGAGCLCWVTAAAFMLPNAANAGIIVSEVAPWSSSYGDGLLADWFELTNTGTSAVTITGWKMDDDSTSFSKAVVMNGITSVAAGESVLFVEGSNSVVAAFKTLWFGANPPAGLQVGSYTGSGIGLGTGGDAVNIYSSAGVLQANVSFGTSDASSPYQTFDNAAGLNSTTISALSAVGTHGAFAAATDPAEIGSPGAIAAATPTLTGAATAATFTTTYGTASPAQAFSVSGANLTANITATAPTGFQVSSDGTTYGTTATFTQSGGAASGSLRVRLAATAAVTGSYNDLNVQLTSSGAGTVNVTTLATGNSVSPKGLTITGVSAVAKIYDRTNIASVSGSPVYAGLVNSENFAVTGTPTATFSDAAAATGKTVTLTGYTAPSPNYTVTQPRLTADITPLALTVSSAAVATKPFDGTTTATLTGTLVGVIAPDVVTLSGSGTFASPQVGSGIAVTSTSTLGGADAANYALTQPTGLTGNITGSTGVTGVDLSRYVRIGRYDLPETTRTTPPANSMFCQEASNVTYNWDTDTLFITGDGGTSVVQVSKTGQLIDSMTLAQGGSSQGTEFYDTEGLTYIGGGQFVMTEERDRQLVRFTYVPGGTLTRTVAKTVKLGTTVGNIGLEGVTWDPLTNGFICVKEKDPQSVFQTTVDFNAGSASNGSPTTTNSTDLFNPSLAGTADFSDAFALSNLPGLSGQTDSSHLLIISQESGQIINIDRSGTVSSRLTIVADPGSPLTVPDMTMEGVTMDRSGYLYITNENGGGDANHPQLWVYAASTATNVAPTAVALINAVNSIPENTSTSAHVKVAEIVVTDDGLGVNNLTVSGTDASCFEIVGTGLYLKAGTSLSATTQPGYSVTVDVDDITLGNTPDATTTYSLSVTAATGGTAALIISEVAPWSSSNGVGLLADWFEVTNTGNAAANISGWKTDDNSSSFGSAVALNGIASIAPGESVIFIESAAPATAVANFKTLWFGSNPPAGMQIGTYTGSGIGLSTGGDAVNLFDSTGTLQANVVVGTSPAGPFATFDNAAGLNHGTLSTLSAIGIHGAFLAASDSNEIGSPGTIGASSAPIVSITATDANASENGTDPGTFQIARSGSTVGLLTVNYTIATGSGQATSADYTPTLTGVASIPSGQASVDITITPADDSLIEGPATLTLTLGDTGSYDVGSPASATVTISDNDPLNQAPAGVVLSNTVTALQDSTSTASAVKLADIAITDDGQGTNSLSLSGADAGSFQITGSALYLQAGIALSYATKPSYSVTVIVDDTTVGSTPDLSANFTLGIVPGSIVITEVNPAGSSAAYAADWFEVTNTGASDVNISGWSMDDGSNGTVKVALRGVTLIPAGKSAVFFEGTATGTTDAAIAAAFSSAWFGSSASPSGFFIGAYGGSGVGLSSTADAVNLFDSAGNRVTGVSFGAATVGTTFDNTAGLGSATLPLPAIATLSVIGTHGAFRSATNAETGSPGTTVNSTSPIGTWRQSFFGTTDTSGDYAATADFDRDGVPNLLEYALGTNPTAGSGVDGLGALPAKIMNDSDPVLSDRLALSFSLPNPNPTDVTYLVQAADDLAAWTDIASKTGAGAWTWLAGGGPRIVTSGSGSVTVRIGDAEPASGNPRRMMRLKVSNP